MILTYKQAFARIRQRAPHATEVAYVPGVPGLQDAELWLYGDEVSDDEVAAVQSWLDMAPVFAGAPPGVKARRATK